MPEAKIAMSVREPATGVKVIDIDGELTAFCEPILTAAYGEADQTGIKTIILNFEKLGYMNSGGIGLLVTILIRAQRKNQRLAAFGLTDHYREIFSLTRLDEAITIFNDETTAVAAS